MRGTIRKRGKASWELKFDVPSEDGKRKTRYATVRGTRQEAQRELTRLLGAADAGTLPDPSNATVAAYIEAWLHGAPKGSAKTMERYGELAANQIIPHLGSHKLQRLKPDHVQHWHGVLIDAGLSAPPRSTRTSCCAVSWAMPSRMAPFPGTSPLFISLPKSSKRKSKSSHRNRSQTC